MIKIKSKSKCELVVDKLLESISEGVYCPGDRLPSENALAEQMDVSRVTIREGLKKLSMMNIISIKQGEGTIVKEVSLESFMEPLLPMLILDKVALTELFDARYYVENGTAFLAAQNRTDEQAEELRSLLPKMQEAYEKKDCILYANLDTEFHLYIAKIAKNSILLRTYKTIRDILQVWLQDLNKYDPAVKASCEWHRKIVDAIFHKESEKARNFMGQHILDANNYWYKLQKKIELRNK